MGNALENGREGRVSLEVGKVWIWSPFTCGVISLLEPILLSELMPICHFQKVDEHPGKNTCPPPSWSVHNSIFNSCMVLLGLFYILKLKEYEYLSRNVSNRFLLTWKKMHSSWERTEAQKNQPFLQKLVWHVLYSLFTWEAIYEFRCCGSVLYQENPKGAALPGDSWPLSDLSFVFELIVIYF